MDELLKALCVLFALTFIVACCWQLVLLIMYSWKLALACVLVVSCLISVVWRYDNYE